MVNSSSAYDGGGDGLSSNPYTFKGSTMSQAVGIPKFGLRWYDPYTGAWMQQDTLDAPLDPSNANRYAYAGDDPINNSDQNGNISLDIFEKLVHAYFTGESLLDVLSSESLLAYTSSFIFEFECDAAVGVLTGGIGVIIGAVGCGILSDDLAKAVDKVAS